MATTGGAPRLRASDAERRATVEALQEAMARGLLTHEETDERMAAAFAARFRDELPPLTADLPPAPQETSAAASPMGWRALFAAVTALLRAEWAAAAAAGFRSRRFVLTALVVVALLAGLALVVVGHGIPDGGYEHVVPRDHR